MDNYISQGVKFVFKMDRALFTLLLSLTSFYILHIKLCHGEVLKILATYEESNCSMYSYDPRPSADKVPVRFDIGHGLEMRFLKYYTERLNIPGITPPLFHNSKKYENAFCRNPDMTMSKTRTKYCCWRGWRGQKNVRQKCFVYQICPITVYCGIPDSKVASLAFEHCCGNYSDDDLYMDN